jgi:16S rRNA (cytosine967-C5)-methyltransferase
MPVSPARAAAFDILLRVDQQNAYAGELLHSPRVDKLSSSDRALATEIVMGVLRWQSQLDRHVAANARRSWSRLDAQVQVALRMAAYQLLYLTRIPARAAIHESVELVKRAHKTSAAPFANAVLRKLAGQVQFFTATDNPSPSSRLASELAHPEWLVERWIKQFGSFRAEAVCRHDQRVPATSIRVDSQEIVSELEGVGISLTPGALLTSARVVASGDVTQTRAFREGRVFVQDEASQLVAALVGRGTRLLDCCAAPGGKTAALAARNPSAEIVAAELHPHRAELLRRRVRSSNVQVLATDVLRLPLQGGFDRVLADVPCSGTGTLARNPEIKWRLRPQDLDGLHARQVAILRAALRQLAPGGRAVYSTCSLEEEENQGVISEVLEGNSPFVVRDCRVELDRLRGEGELAGSEVDSLLDGPYLRTIPGVSPGDGFFAAILQRPSQQS